MNQKADVLYSEEQIARRVAELGAEIARAFEGRELCVLGLMNGSIVFMADLVRRIPLDLTFHLVRVSVHREREAGVVRTEIAYALTSNLAIRRRQRIEFKPEWFDPDSDEVPETDEELVDSEG